MIPYSKLLRRSSLDALFQACRTSGIQVEGPVKSESGAVDFAHIERASEISENHILTRLSAKEYVFPRTEKLFSYRKKEGEVILDNFDFEAIPHRLIWGMRPCDAAGIEALSGIFNWEPKDAIYQARRARTTFVSIACTQSDAACFCTSLGSGPQDGKGSDMLMIPLENGDFLAEIRTAKGDAIVSLAPDLFEDVDVETIRKHAVVAAEPKKYFDYEKVYDQINAKFDTSLFEEQALACLGCGACAFICPSCGCFDIQDEAKGNKGVRIRCWDSCGTKLFTMHTSGHNPRDTQGKRWRQRLMHKFSYMPDRLKVAGCVGCGRCTRSCPAGMSIALSIKQIVEE